MKVLQVVTSAYRATIEEQDDTILWLTQAVRNADGALDVLLSGAAVNYALAGQDASGVTIGPWRQTQPPHIEDDIARLINRGARVFAVAEDVAVRGIASRQMVSGVSVIKREQAAALMGEYDQVWRW